ncbi:MAG: hypothetical protein AAF628_13260 [Planctomycetota bacterium]
MFWEISQQVNIRRSQATADSAVERAADAKASAEALQSTLDRVLLINRALWEIVRDQHGLNDEQLRDKVSEIDMRDGVMDGRLRQEARRCPGCDRVMNRRHRHCLYCGAQDLEADVFDSA